MKSLSVLLVLVFFELSFPQSITLRDTTNQYDYIIITVPEFVQSCQTFKQHKESYNGFNLFIVDTGQIFNEFNSDSLPQNNIREFISYAGTYWQNPKLKYVLIVGNISAVPNFYIDPVSPQWYIKYYQSDYYYKNNLFDTDTTKFDYNVGRIPALNIQEVQNYFNKIISYETNIQIESWMNSNLFLCETSLDFKFVDKAIWIGQGLPTNINQKFIEDAGSQYYGNRDSLFNHINYSGTSILWFIGYPNDSTFMRDPVFIDLNDLSLLNNADKYFLSVHFSQSSIMDTNTNISREMLFIEDAGSLGAIVVNGIPYYPYYTYVERLWAGRFYEQEIQSISEAVDTIYTNIGIGFYLRKAINFLGDPSLKLKYDATVNVSETEDEIPNNYVLHSNYPNPYNNSTKIDYEIPVQSNVSIILYDALGREVATLVNEVKPSGKHQFSFVENNLVSGVYFYTLRAGNYTQTKKMILLK
jgi:hypothetical protein